MHRSTILCTVLCVFRGSLFTLGKDRNVTRYDIGVCHPHIGFFLEGGAHAIDARGSDAFCIDAPAIAFDVEEKYLSILWVDEN